MRRRKKKVQDKTEPELIQYQDEDDQGDWEEQDEDEWSRWYHEDEHTEKEESSKESSFVVVSEGKRTSTEAAESSPKEERQLR